MERKVDSRRHKMTGINFLLAFLVLLSASASASAADKASFLAVQKYDKEGAIFADRLLAQIREAFKEQYPCATVTADTDLAVAIKWDRERQVITPTDDSMLHDIAGSLGANYLIKLNVISSNGKVSMSASCMNLQAVKPIAKKSTVVDNGEGAIDAADSLAEEFVSDMLDALPECIVDDWSGTITFKQTIDEPSKTTETWVEGNGTRTTDIDIFSSTTARFVVRGTKRPLHVSVDATWQSSKTVVSKGTAECGGRVLGEKPKTIPWNETEEEKVQASAGEGKLEANVGVTVDGNHWTISFTVPEIPGTMTRDWTLTSSGRCGPPFTKKNDPAPPAEWKRPGESRSVEGDAKNPDVIKGSQSDGTTTIEYDLKFVHAPPAPKPKK